MARNYGRSLRYHHRSRSDPTKSEMGSDSISDSRWGLDPNCDATSAGHLR
jgi:hypothetical protein